MGKYIKKYIGTMTIRINRNNWKFEEIQSTSSTTYETINEGIFPLTLVEAFRYDVCNY